MNILIAGGGTGGHLFPAIAVAEEFSACYPEAAITFVGTAKGLETRIIPHTPWNLVLMNVPQLKGMGFAHKFMMVLIMPFALIRAALLILSLKPAVVVGVGGYAAGPVTLVASLFRIPTVAMEQNAIAGVTNRILGRFVKKVFVTFAESEKYFPKRKVVVSGNPVRRKIRESFGRPQHKKGGFTILVFGGSQGARRINEKILEALSYLAEMRDDLHIIHQIGRIEDTERISAVYRARGFSAEVYHFIEDMGRMYSASDLVVCRAGSTSIAELTCAGKPAIFIPYPYAADNHQEANARIVAAAGGASVIKENELTGERLADEIKKLLSEPLTLTSMAEAMRKMSRPDAARLVVEESMKYV